MPLSENTRGALLMMGAMAAFTLNDTFFKTLSGEMPLFQAIFLRGVVVSFLMYFMVRWNGALRKSVPRKDWGMIALRTFGELGATVFFLTALFHMPIANVTAILQSLPLVLTLVGAVLFGEKVGWRRYVAIMVGLLGVLIIVRPGGEGFSIFSLYAVIAVGFVVIRDLSTRRLSSTTPSILVAFVGAVANTIMGGVVTLTVDWVTVAPEAYVTLSIAAVFIIAGYTLSVMVMRVGQIAVVTPFRYTGILWAIALGYFVFDDFPDQWTLLGSAIVVGMGIYTFYRERKIARTG